MPSSSKKQHKFMEAVAHNPAFAKKAGVPQTVGQDFSNADKGKKFNRGGAMPMDPKMLAMMAEKLKGRTMGGRPAARPPMGARPPMAPPGGMAPPGMKKGGMTKMASGGFVRSADGIAKQGKTKAKQIKMAGGGYTRAADGCAVKGKTKGTQIKMTKGGMAC